VLVVPPKVPVTTLAEFIRFAKTGGRPLTFGSAANGSGGHLAGELFRVMSQAPVVHVPYKGTGPAMTELIGGQIDFMFAAIVPVQPHIKSGRLRAIAVSSLKRAIAAPDIPTVAEAGLPGFEYVGWYGVLAPAGTPQPVIDRLHAEFVQIVRAPDMRERLLADGAEPVGNTPAQFEAYLKTELARWTRIIKEVGTRID
jgi:tripartite-type tricarboxylate transporter receptor subunit TctC